MPLSADNRDRLATLKSGGQLPSGSRGWLNAMLRHGDPDAREQHAVRDLLGGPAPAPGDVVVAGGAGRAEAVRRGWEA
jgi:hypothetical protein